MKDTLLSEFYTKVESGFGHQNTKFLQFFLFEKSICPETISRYVLERIILILNFSFRYIRSEGFGFDGFQRFNFHAIKFCLSREPVTVITSARDAMLRFFHDFTLYRDILKFINFTFLESQNLPYQQCQPGEIIQEAQDNFHEQNKISIY